nr:hypothetical protein [Escherichia coli]
MAITGEEIRGELHGQIPSSTLSITTTHFCRSGVMMELQHQ